MLDLRPLRTAPANNASMAPSTGNPQTGTFGTKMAPPFTLAGALVLKRADSKRLRQGVTVQSPAYPEKTASLRSHANPN